MIMFVQLKLIVVTVSENFEINVITTRLQLSRAHVESNNRIPVIVVVKLSPHGKAYFRWG